MKHTGLVEQRTKEKTNRHTFLVSVTSRYNELMSYENPPIMDMKCSSLQPIYSYFYVGDDGNLLITDNLVGLFLRGSTVVI